MFRDLQLVYLSCLGLSGQHIKVETSVSIINRKRIDVFKKGEYVVSYVSLNPIYIYINLSSAINTLGLLN